MLRTPLVLLALTFAGLSVGSGAQSGSALASAQQKVVLSYFQDVLDGRKGEFVDNLFQPDCALHFGPDLSFCSVVLRDSTFASGGDQSSGTLTHSDGPG